MKNNSPMKTVTEIPRKTKSNHVVLITLATATFSASHTNRSSSSFILHITRTSITTTFSLGSTSLFFQKPFQVRPCPH